MNLSYYSKGRLITNRFIVMKEFIKVHLIIDLIAILSFYDYSDNTQTYGRWWTMFYLIKFMHIVEIKKKYKDNFPLSDK